MYKNSQHHFTRRAVAAAASALLVVVISLLATTLIHGRAYAASLANWNAGLIVSDSVFMNKDAMNPTQIQSFLNSKVPACDTNGTQPSEFGGGTRAQWGASRGYPAPYICLKDYTEGGKGSAQIIYDTAQAFNINPQVLIVLLQKEQGLVTDTWPLPTQYRTATGYGCPDTAPCDSQYYGLTNQLQWSARMFKAIMTASPTWYTPYVLGNNFIRYSPDSSCGGSNVNIQNRATQALYNYTPYQPNQGALNAGYGSAPCGAYGNRNFYLYFTDWFGSTIEGATWRWSLVSQKVYLDANRTQDITTPDVTVRPGGKIYYTVKALNTGNQSWDNMTRLATSGPPGRNSIFYDSSWLSNNRPAVLQESRVVPGSVGTFNFTLTAPQVLGTYREYFNLVADGQTSLNDIGLFSLIDVTNPVAARNNTNITLQRGSTLQKRQYLLSPDGNTVLTLQDDGNLVLLNNFSVVWSSSTSGSGANQLILQNDGNLVLYDNAMKAVWASGTDGTTATSLVLQTDANMVLYKSDQTAAWATYTNYRPNQLDIIARAIRTSGLMYPGQRIETADRTRQLILQTDGNLVLYKGNTPLWASGTDGRDAKFLAMQPDGNLVLYDMNIKPLWSSNTSGGGNPSLEIQDDSNLVIYKSSRAATWATYTNK